MENNRYRSITIVIVAMELGQNILNYTTPFLAKLLPINLIRGTSTPLQAYRYKIHDY